MYQFVISPSSLLPRQAADEFGRQAATGLVRKAEQSVLWRLGPGCGEEPRTVFAPGTLSFGCDVHKHQNYIE
jgi:hypothetical protein